MIIPIGPLRKQAQRGSDMPKVTKPVSNGSSAQLCTLAWDPHLRGPMFPVQGSGRIPALGLPGSPSISSVVVPGASTGWKVLWEGEEHCYHGPKAATPVSGNIRVLPVLTQAGHSRNATHATQGYCLCWLRPRRLRVHGLFP